MTGDTLIATKIKLLLSDVDGVLTNGLIIYDNAGVETKAFHARDGVAIKLWQKAGLTFGIVTARSSEIVRQRAKDLGITSLRQGCEDKWTAACELMEAAGVRPDETCYIGDDLPDLAVMRNIALPVAVADAADDVRASAKWITRAGGGMGAVRELVERLLRARSQWEEVAGV